MTIQVVDDEGKTIGEIEKIAAHQNGGVWHRAISVFLFDSFGRLLIQKRAKGKYHFAGLWANSCCSHPSANETPAEAANRAMQFELGISATVSEIGVVRYEATDAASGQTEREHDHILVGRFLGQISPNTEEIAAIRWVALAELKQEIQLRPEQFAPWLPTILDQIPELSQQNFG